MKFRKKLLKAVAAVICKDETRGGLPNAKIKGNGDTLTLEATNGNIAVTVYGDRRQDALPPSTSTFMELIPENEILRLAAKIDDPRRRPGREKDRAFFSSAPESNKLEMYRVEAINGENGTVSDYVPVNVLEPDTDGSHPGYPELVFSKFVPERKLKSPTFSIVIDAYNASKLMAVMIEALRSAGVGTESDYKIKDNHSSGAKAAPVRMDFFEGVNQPFRISAFSHDGELIADALQMPFCQNPEDFGGKLKGDRS